MGKWRNKSVEIVIEKYQCSIFMYLRASWSRQLPHSTNCCQSNLSFCTFEDITLKLQQNINNWTYRQLDFLFFAIISFSGYIYADNYSSQMLQRLIFSGIILEN